MLVTQEQLASLLSFRPNGSLVTSLYLGLDPKSRNKKQVELAVRELVDARLQELKASAIEPALVKAVRRDLDAVSECVGRKLQGLRHPGLAVFSCSAQDFFQFYPLPRTVRSRLIVDTTPYVRPLSVTLDHYRRIGVVILNKTTARILEFYMGELKEHPPVDDEVPGKVRTGGWRGFDEARMRRSLAQKVHGHFKHSADTIFRLHRASRFEAIVIVAKAALASEFEQSLHTYLQERVVARLDLPVSVTPERLRKELIRVEQEVRGREELSLVDKLYDEVHAGGLAVVGLDATLQPVNKGVARVLVLSRAYSRPGFMCPDCGHLSGKQKQCPQCGKPSDKVADVVDEAVEAALWQGVEVRHVAAGTRLDADGAGAFLRFKA